MPFLRQCFLLFVFFTVSCTANLAKIGDPRYPSLEQLLFEEAQRIKETLPEKTALIVYVSEKNKHDSATAEFMAIKILQIGIPKITVLESKGIAQAFEEFEKQPLDLSAQNADVLLGNIIKAQYMIMPETSPEENFSVELYNKEMDQPFIYRKKSLKIQVLELSSGKILWTEKNSYWEVSPDQKIAQRYLKKLLPSQDAIRYVLNRPNIIIKPNEPVQFRPLYVNQGFKKAQPDKKHQKKKQGNGENQN